MVSSLSVPLSVKIFFSSVTGLVTLTGWFPKWGNVSNLSTIFPILKRLCFWKISEEISEKRAELWFFIFYILYPFWPKVWRNRAPKWIIEIGVEELGRAEYSYLTKQPHQFKITLEHHSHASNLNNKYIFLLSRWRVASVKTVSRKIDFVGKFFAELNAYFFAIILHFRPLAGTGPGQKFSNLTNRKKIWK